MDFKSRLSRARPHDRQTVRSRLNSIPHTGDRRNKKRSFCRIQGLIGWAALRPRAREDPQTHRNTRHPANQLRAVPAPCASLHAEDLLEPSSRGTSAWKSQSWRWARSKYPRRLYSVWPQQPHYAEALAVAFSLFRAPKAAKRLGNVGIRRILKLARRWDCWLLRMKAHYNLEVSRWLKP